MSRLPWSMKCLYCNQPSSNDAILTYQGHCSQECADAHADDLNDYWAVDLDEEDRGDG